MYSSDFVYQKYKADCHSSDAGDLTKSKPAKLLPVPTDFPLWTSAGTAGKFMWRALTSVFPPQVHTIDANKIKYNDYHDTRRLEGGLYMMSRVFNSMKKDPMIAPLMKRVLAINTNVLYTGAPEKVLFDGMYEFLRQNTLDDSEVFYIEGQQANVNFDVIQGKDLIYPGLFVVPDTLKTFAEVASALCENGANTCVGIFLTRLMPNEQGQYPPYLPKEMALPLIQGLSFSDLVNMF